jgi:hypothetical protein
VNTPCQRAANALCAHKFCIAPPSFFFCFGGRLVYVVKLLWVCRCISCFIVQRRCCSGCSGAARCSALYHLCCLAVVRATPDLPHPLNHCATSRAACALQLQPVPPTPPLVCGVVHSQPVVQNMPAARSWSKAPVYRAFLSHRCTACRRTTDRARRRRSTLQLRPLGLPQPTRDQTTMQSTHCHDALITVEIHVVRYSGPYVVVPEALWSMPI